MTPLALAWANLKAQRLRTTISILGIVFAVELIYMQLGFLGTVKETAGQLFDRLRFDVILVSSEYLDLNRASHFPRSRLTTAASAPGISSIVPLSASIGLWRDPRGDEVVERHSRWTILMIGIPPEHADLLFTNPTRLGFHNQQELVEQIHSLDSPGNILFDRLSRQEFGSPTDRAIGTFHEVNDERVRIKGEFEIGPGFGYNGILMTSESTYARLTRLPNTRTTFGLIRLQTGIDPAVACEELNRRLPLDTRAVTKSEIIEMERDFWVNSTATGRLFSFGVFIALIVGIIFVTQMMSGDIRKMLPEYATIKAMGYPPDYLSQVVVAQSLILGGLGALFGLLTALVTYEITREQIRIPIFMNFERIGFVSLLTVAMCLVAGLIAMRKVHTADPAELF